MAFMFTQSLISVTLSLLSNMSAAILVDLSSLFPELILTMVITWPFITTSMKIILLLGKLFPLLILLSCLSSTSLKKISRWHVTMAYMPDIAKSTTDCTGQSINQNTGSSLISTPGATAFFLLWAMIPCNVQAAKKKCSFWSCIINMNGFLWRNYIKGQW